MTLYKSIYIYIYIYLIHTNLFVRSVCKVLHLYKITYNITVYSIIKHILFKFTYIIIKPMKLKENYKTNEIQTHIQTNNTQT